MPKLTALFSTLLLLVAAACGATETGPGEAARVDITSQAEAVEAETATTAEQPEATTTAGVDEADETTTTAEPDDVTEPAIEAPLLISPFGLSFQQADGSLETLGQGTPQDEILAALEAALGPRPDETLILTDCGAFTSWPGVIDVVFDTDVGPLTSWGLPEGSPLIDQNGIGLGSTRAELETAWKTTFFDEEDWGVQFLVEGVEELVDGMGGLVDGTGSDAVIISLWGGTPCLAS